MTPKWTVREYMIDKPTDYVRSLIENGHTDGIALAMYVKKMEKYSHCHGKCLKEVSSGIWLWVLSGKTHHIIYSFNRTTQQLFYLTAFNGVIDDHIPEAETRLSKMYQ